MRHAQELKKQGAGSREIICVSMLTLLLAPCLLGQQSTRGGGGGTTGALTNNETRDVVLLGSLTITNAGQTNVMTSAGVMFTNVSGPSRFVSLSGSGQDLKTGASTSITSGNTITGPQFQISGNNGYLQIGTHAYFQGGNIDGVVDWFKNSGTGFERFRFGSTAAAGTALVLTNVNGIEVKQATAIGYTNLLVLGIATTSATATNAIVATGYTNAFAVNVQAVVTATAVSFTVKNAANSVIYTSPTLSTTLNIVLQPGWAITAASGLAGGVIPF